MSLTAEGLISSLYFATLPQVLQDFLKRQVGFVGPRLEGGQILTSSARLSLTARLTKSDTDWSVSAALSRKARCRSGSK